MSAAGETLAALRTAVARIEAGGTDRPLATGRIVLGPAAVDEALGGGLRRGALHVVSAGPAGAGAATGFAAALAGLAAGQGRSVLWIRQDMAAQESGEPWGPGLAGIGLDPDRLVMLRAADFPSSLKAAEAALACSALAAVVIEPFGAMAGFDRVAGRRLALAAGRSGALAVMLRAAPSPGLPAGLSAAETRWRVAPLSSSWIVDAPAGDEESWGRPVALAELVRNRLGGLGRWPLAWGFDDGAFRLAERGFDAFAGREPGAAGAADSRGRVPEPSDRQDQTARTPARRRAG